MVRPVQPFPMRKLDGTTVWIDPRTNKEIKDSKMNERIRELAEQAKGFVDLNQHVGGEKGCMVYTYNGLEKFAELIVRECSRYIEDKFDFCGDEIIIAESVLKHFGVGE